MKLCHHHTTHHDNQDHGPQQGDVKISSYRCPGLALLLADIGQSRIDLCTHAHTQTHQTIQKVVEDKVNHKFGPEKASLALASAAGTVAATAVFFSSSCCCSASRRFCSRSAHSGFRSAPPPQRLQAQPRTADDVKVRRRIERRISESSESVCHASHGATQELTGEAEGHDQQLDSSTHRSSVCSVCVCPSTAHCSNSPRFSRCPCCVGCTQETRTQRESTS